MRRVAVGMSGGVDSSVAAYLLRKQGYQVVGVYMNNWDVVDELTSSSSSRAGAAATTTTTSAEALAAMSGSSGMAKKRAEADEKIEISKRVCSSRQDRKDAEAVCSALGVEFKYVEFIERYWNDVFQRTLDSYNMGFTPNPDAYCNREIKFDAFIEYALRELGVDFVATGHYARIMHGHLTTTAATAATAISNSALPLPSVYDVASGSSRLLKATDAFKDQTYFLSLIRPTHLHRVLFPIGHLYKSQVRDIAKSINLPNAEKKESMGICFIGKRKLSDFLDNYLALRPATFMSLEGHKVLGERKGGMIYTIGQKANIAGLDAAYYVAAKDNDRGILYVVDRLDHPALFRDEFFVSEMNWIAPNPFAATVDGHSLPSMDVTCRLRHQMAPIECSITLHEQQNNQSAIVLKVKTKKKIRGVAPGQIICFYDGDHVLGGGVLSLPQQ